MAFILTPFGRVPPSRAIDKTLVAETSPATRVAPASIGAGAGKIADWSIAGRIGEGQPVPRFGSVARSPLTGRGSDGRPVQFRDWCVVRRVVGGLSPFHPRLVVGGAANPVPSHGANERLGQFLDTCAVPAAAAFARLQVVAEFVRARLAGLPGLARIAVQRVGAALAGAVLQVKQVWLGRVLHARIIGMGDPDDRGSMVQELGSEREDAR